MDHTPEPPSSPEQSSIDHTSIHFSNGHCLDQSTSVAYKPTNTSGIAIERPVVATNEQSGKDEIQTQHYTQYPTRPSWQRPLTQRYMKVIKCLSIACAVTFFPTGIPAAFYAWKTQLEFDVGILRGDIDKAQRCAKRCERLMILTVVCALLTAVLIVAIVERVNMGAPRNLHGFHPRQMSA